MTIYLKFPSREEAITKLTAAGFVVSEDTDHCQAIEGWGSAFAIPEQSGYFVNLYDCECPDTLKPYEVAVPVTPYNVKWEL